ncbi:MAG: tetratricopeptide repeat protein [Elusimicrobia bacterium]|nr:tetratricopeptide repeat protein [Elusimicrobiota bacterium]
MAAGPRLRLAAPLLQAALLAACAAPPRLAQRASPEAVWFEMDRAYSLLRENKRAEAAAVLRRVLEDDPANRQARLELAYVCIQLRDWKEALRQLDRAIENDPDDPRLRMELGYVREALGQESAAADEFSMAARRPGELQAQAREALARSKASLKASGLENRQLNLLDAGYDKLRQGDRAAARKDFESALADDPGRAEILKQLGYMSIEDDDPAAAAARFEGARRLAPLDETIALELGYIYHNLHNDEKAERCFRSVENSPDTMIRDAARAGLMTVRARKQRLFLDIYAGPFHDTRFNNTIGSAEAQLGARPGPRWPLHFYMGGRVSRDSRSRSGTEPQIFSDQTAMLGWGVKLQPPGWNANLLAEAGIAWNLMRDASHPRAREADYRVVWGDSRYWDGRWHGPLGLLTLGQVRLRKAYTDAGVSAGYYSRYHDNVIAYLQLQDGVKLWYDGISALSLFAPCNVVKDSKRDFFNNLAELGAGLEYQPRIRINLRLRVEALRGFYFGIAGRDPNPYGSGYYNLRFLLVYSGRTVFLE